MNPFTVANSIAPVQGLKLRHVIVVDDWTVPAHFPLHLLVLPGPGLIIISLPRCVVQLPWRGRNPWTVWPTNGRHYHIFGIDQLWPIVLRRRMCIMQVMQLQ